jgi:hypothetical protein
MNPVSRVPAVEAGAKSVRTCDESRHTFAFAGNRFRKIPLACHLPVFRKTGIGSDSSLIF